jgi:chromosome segregation ATPase
MAQEMSFAQALNEAKAVIVQLSTRVKADAEKIRTQQQTIVSQSSTISQLEGRVEEQDAQTAQNIQEIAALTDRLHEVEEARENAESMVNRQGEKITSLQSANAELEARLTEHKAQIVELSQELGAIRAQLPSDEDAAALASMAQLLIKAAPAIEKARKTTAPQMRLTDSDEPIAQAA